jgi:hypothetical protein
MSRRPASAVKGLSRTETNYDITWNTYSNNSNGKKMNGNIIPLPQKEALQLSLFVHDKRKRYRIANAK